MANVVLCSAAEKEYAEALTWYLKQSNDVAERFDAELSRTLETIAAYPQRSPFCDERHPFCLMRRFPYQIIYRANDDHVVIVADTLRLKSLIFKVAD